jgi:hypothetical protein
MALALYFHVFALTTVITYAFIFYFLLKDPLVRNNRVSQLMLAAFISGMIWVITTYINRVFISGENLFIEAILGLIGNLSALLIYTFLSLFMRSFIKPEANTKILATFALLISIALGIRFLSLSFAMNNQQDLYVQTREATNLFNLIALAYTFYVITHDYHVMLARKLGKKQLLQIRLFFYPIMISLLLSFVIIIIVAITTDINLISLGFISSTITNTVVVWAFIRDPRIASLFNDHLYLFLLANRYGSLKFGKNLYSEDTKQPVLLSGITSAIVSLINDLYDFTLEPISTKFDNGFIHFVTHEHYFLVAFSEKESKLIKQSMKKFSTRIQENYESNLETIMKNDQQLNLESLFNECFYFLQPQGFETPKQVRKIFDQIIKPEKRRIGY